MLTYGWKQPRRSPRCNAMKNHALQQRRGAGAVPLSPSWQVCSATWQLSISMINAVVPGLPVAKLKSVLLPHSKVKWKRAQCHKRTEGKQMTKKKEAHLNFYTSTHRCECENVYEMWKFTLDHSSMWTRYALISTSQSPLLDHFSEWRTEQVYFGAFQNWFLG